MSIVTIKQVTLTNVSNNPIVALILAVVGSNVALKLNDYGDGVDGSILIEDFILEDGYTNNLMISNDNSWGSVTSIDMFDEHMILTANFGDDGEYKFCATIDFGNGNTFITLDGMFINKLTASEIGFLQTFDTLINR
jgi:hypothetical protein